MGKIPNLIGKQFGHWTVISFDRTDKHHRSFWFCSCSCGIVKSILNRQLTTGKSKSCGCVNKKHLESAVNISKEYRAWSAIKTRCLNKKSKAYLHYGGRGIEVCNRWLESYDNFISDMGRSPSPKHSIDRIDVNGNYDPSNCRWATYKEQANNRRSSFFITYKGRTMTAAMWSDETGIKEDTIRWRFYNCKIDEIFKPTRIYITR